MLEESLFIGRTDEIEQISNCVKKYGKNYIIVIYGDGGIGKSRLINEIKNIYNHKAMKHLAVTEVIDFDDLAFHISQNITRKISEMLGEQIFKSYLDAEIDFRKMQKSGVSRERLIEERESVSRIFIDCFNEFSTKKRVVLFFDTTDKLDKRKEIWNDLIPIFKDIKNAVVIISGRDAEEIVKGFNFDLKGLSIEYIRLKPFEENDSKTYIYERCRQKNIPKIEADLVDKIIFLTEGKPVLLDLAVEWRARGIDLDWFEKGNVNELARLESVNPEELKRKKKQVEKELVSHINKLQDPRDRLILLLSHVFPLNVEMLQKLLDIDNIAGEKVFEDAKNFVFIKSLPNGFISLHDVMRDMVHEYVWPEIDPYRLKLYSKKALELYEKEINNLNSEIKRVENNINTSDIQVSPNTFEDSLSLSKFEQQLWVLKEEYLRHSLYVDINNGVKTFIETFEEATKQARLPLRKRFINLLEKQEKKLSIDQKTLLEYYKAKQIYDEGTFKEVKNKCEQLLNREEISAEKKVDILLLKGNAEIRLGNIEESIQNFKKAVEISESNDELKLQKIESKNALGWSHRLTGNLIEAQKLYTEAKRLCMELGGPENPKLTETYGLILNNFAFVLSNDNSTRKAAIDMANTAIAHWRKIDNNIGLGAGSLVLGIAYYRSDLSEDALIAFREALNIFEPLGNNDWLGQIYSWRGAQYHDINEFEKAKADFEKALEIGAENIKAMTLNRLARVYMNKQKWDKAEELMTESLELAKRLPDYIYWIGSIARLISISAKKYINDREKIANEFDKYVKEINIFNENFKFPDKNSLGIAYLSLAKLLFLLNDENRIDEIIKYLTEGIPYVVEFGSFARTDIQTRLDIIEQDFNKTDPKIIRTVGEKMFDYIQNKEAQNLNYTTAVDILLRWKNWNK